MALSLAFLTQLSLRNRALFALFLGALSVFGFAPFYFFPLPIVCLTLLFAMWRSSETPGRGFALGFCFGLGFFCVGVSWVYVSLHNFGAMPMPLAAIATFLFCVILAIYPGLAGLIQQTVALTSWMKLMLFIPALWALFEWLRGWMFTGFPWLAIGYSQVPDSPLAGLAPVFGLYGVSFFTAMVAGALCYLIFHKTTRANKAYVISAVLALCIISWMGKAFEWTKPKGAPTTVSLLQGNIPQDVKWSENNLRTSLRVYLDLASASSAKLIVMPETALPLFSDQVPGTYIDMLSKHAAKNKADVLIGLPERDVQRNEYYNSVVSVGTSPTQVYRKSHLVPFGEFVPFKALFGPIIAAISIPLTDFSRGSVEQQPLRVGGQLVAMNICYEDAFGELIIRQLPQATLLANVSNVAWFGDSWAPMQHLQISQTRAVETGRYMLRATNTGMTAVIDQHGKVVSKAPAFTQTVLNAEVQGFVGSTPYIRWGNRAVLILILGVIAGCAVACVLKNRRSK